MHGWMRGMMVAGMVLTAGLRALAYPYPTFYGDTGLVQAPTADVKPLANFQIAVDTISLREPNQVERLLPIRFVYGASGVGEFALFLAESPEQLGYGRDIWGAAGKVQLLREELRDGVPGFAVGGRFVQDKREVTCGETSAYLVLSKSLFYHNDDQMPPENPYERHRDSCFYADPPPFGDFAFRIHVGGMVSHLSDSTERQADFIYPFGGVSFTNGSGTEAAVDFFPKLEKHGCVFRPATYSGVLRLRASDSLALEVGATRPYLRGCQTSPFLGIIYIYDPAKDHSDNRGCGGCGW